MNLVFSKRDSPNQTIKDQYFGGQFFPAIFCIISDLNQQGGGHNSGI